MARSRRGRRGMARRRAVRDGRDRRRVRADADAVMTEIEVAGLAVVPAP